MYTRYQEMQLLPLSLRRMDYSYWLGSSVDGRRVFYSHIDPGIYCTG